MYIYIYIVCIYNYIYIMYIFHHVSVCIFGWEISQKHNIFEKPLRQVEVTCPPCVAAAVGSSPSWEVIKCPKKEKHKAEMPQTWGMFVRSVDTFLDTCCGGLDGLEQYLPLVLPHVSIYFI